MTQTADQLPTEAATRMEELGRIILAYSEVTEKLQQSHDRLKEQVNLLRSELSEKNRLLERRNRLAALGEMAAGMAHEIRNPLGGIQLYASMLARDVADRPASAQLVGKISGGVRRLEGLVSQVLQFTREITPNVERTDLSDVVEQSVELAAERCERFGVKCEVSGPRPMPVLVDPNLIGQALLNLVLNAADAVGEAAVGEAAGGAGVEAGRIVVRYGPPPAGSDARQFHLTVRDNGPGIPPQVMEKLFNPFFTTKDTGTGLGLSIVHRVVEAHDGTIVATNADGGGARFEIRV